MIYFDARLSARYPTVEIRVCDVCPTVEDAVTIAGVARALVDTVETASRAVPPAPTRVEVLRAAGWRAARFGLTDELVDPAADPSAPVRLVPAGDVVDALLAHIGPALDAAGDGDRVRAGLDRIRERGTGAEVQRRAARDGGPAAAVDAVAISPVDQAGRV
jgi:glutamate---cysteine ligase / carboxylate-amine ligase